MNASAGRFALLAGAVAHLVLGVMLVLATWDGLYSTLDLPKPVPAVTAQVGGVALVALAYLAWRAARLPALAATVAFASSAANAGGAVIIGLWLALRGKADLEVGTGGIVILAVVAVLLALLAVGQLAAQRRLTG